MEGRAALNWRLGQDLPVRFKPELRSSCEAPELKSLGIDSLFDRLATKIVGRGIARRDRAGGGSGTMVLWEFAAREVGREGTQIFPRFRLENIDPHSSTCRSRKFHPCGLPMSAPPKFWPKSSRAIRLTKAKLSTPSKNCCACDRSRRNAPRTQRLIFIRGCPLGVIVDLTAKALSHC